VILHATVIVPSTTVGPVRSDIVRSDAVFAEARCYNARGE